MWAWEKRTFIKQLIVSEVDNFDVFSEFDCDRDADKESPGSFAQSSQGESNASVFKGSTRSFQYTQNYSLPKTQTHKKFLAVFKSNRPGTLNSISNSKNMGFSVDKDISDSKIFNHTDKSKDFDSSVQLLKKRSSLYLGCEIKMPSSSIQRVVRFQRDKTNYVASPRANISRLKPRTLSSVISSLKFPEKKELKRSDTSTSRTKADQLEEIHKRIQEKLTRLKELQKSLEVTTVSNK
jgi:hypothetical protein